MSSFPLSDEDMKKLVIRCATDDAENTADTVDGLDDSALYDIADNAWFYSGWMSLECDERFMEHMSELSEVTERLKLSSLYQDTFVEAAKKLRG